MKKLNKLFLLSLIFLIFSCKKEEPKPSLEEVKYNTNQKSYPSTKMDSALAINKITKQKIQELLDLSVLYNAGKKDTEIDSVVYSQMQNYFYKPDSMTFKPLFKELESLKVKKAKVNSLEVYKKTFKNDTLDFAKFDVEYFDDTKPIGKYQRDAQYILLSAPIQFKREFKFYFLNFYKVPPNDSILSGVTK